MFVVPHIFAFIAFAMGTIRNPESLSPYSDMFHTTPAMCKASLLRNIGVLSTFHIEKQTILLFFSNVDERRKKRKIMQRLKDTLWPPKPLQT
jgi:hypothetical protein